MKYYVIVADWSVDYEAGHEVVGVYTSKEDAIAALQKRVDADDRPLANEYRYEIFEDNELRFDASIPGYYAESHLYVGIEEVDMGTERIAYYAKGYLCVANMDTKKRKGNAK